MTTVEALADMTPEQLEAIEGIGPKTVEKISLAVNNYFSSLEGGEAVPEKVKSPTKPASEETAAGADDITAEQSGSWPCRKLRSRETTGPEEDGQNLERRQLNLRRSLLLPRRSSK